MDSMSGDDTEQTRGLVSGTLPQDRHPLRAAVRELPPLHGMGVAQPNGCCSSTAKVRALPMAVAVLVMVLLVGQFRGGRAPGVHSSNVANRKVGFSSVWAPGGDSIMDSGKGKDKKDLANSQFTDHHKGEAAAQECDDPAHSSYCFKAVQFAMNDGIKHQPSWYPGLTEKSTFKEFQQFLYEEGRSSCPKPCQESSGEDSGEHGGENTGGGHSGSSDGEHASHGSDASHGHEHPHGYIALCFLLGGLSIGCIIQVVQERLLSWIPYTCLLFMMGLVLASIHELRPPTHFTAWPTWYQSVSMWEQVDPHLIFHVFLPLLVFAEAMRLNIKLAMQLFMQVLLLAVPGVVLGTLGTAAFVHEVLPYGWSWSTCLVFGSILAATDPVAVVALFNTLGVSPRLTMLISGESLLNDGTAIVLFMSMLKIMLGDEFSASVTGLFFLQMTLLAILLGSALAAVGLFLVARCAETKYHTDPMIQVCVTMCLSMLCFFVAESEVKTSGVLTVVTAGCVFSHYAWPLFASRETLHIVWEAVEFIGNTVIFLLAGLLFGHRCISRTGHLTGYDIGWLFVLYFAVTAIRAVMVLILWPLLNCLGDRVTWREALVMIWSGLRGAVGLVLAIMVDEEKAILDTVGSRFMFHIGGIAMLTIAINATLCAPLLKSLGLTKPPHIDHMTAEHLEKLVKKDAKEAFTEIEKSNQEDSNRRWAGTNFDTLKELLPSLCESVDEDTGHNSHCHDDKAAELRVYRETFMRYVQSQYWNDIEEGIIPRTSRVARVLLFSTADALLQPDKKLDDWKVVFSKSSNFTLCPQVGDLIARIWPLNTVQWLQNVLPAASLVQQWKVYLAVCFIEAHRSACEDIPQYFAGCDVISESARIQVAEESESQVKEAKEFLESLPKDTVVLCKNRMLAGKLLNRQLEKVASLAKSGLLDEKGASHIAHRLQAEHRALSGATLLRPEKLGRVYSKVDW